MFYLPPPTFHPQHSLVTRFAPTKDGYAAPVSVTPSSSLEYTATWSYSTTHLTVAVEAKTTGYAKVCTRWCDV